MDTFLAHGKCQSLPPHEDALSLAEAVSEFFIICDILSELSQYPKEMICPPIQSLLKLSAVKLMAFTRATEEEILSIM